jgi:hypothetical protein
LHMKRQTKYSMVRLITGENEVVKINFISN